MRIVATTCGLDCQGACNWKDNGQVCTSLHAILRTEKDVSSNPVHVLAQIA